MPPPTTPPPTSFTLGPRVRDLESPLTAEMLRALEPECDTVQFRSMLTDAEFRQVSELIRPRPDIMLRAYNSYDGRIPDLEFLRFFPQVTEFQADLWTLTSLDGLRHLPDNVTLLAFGRHEARLDLKALSRFTGLRRLYLEGPWKNLDAIGTFTELIDLTLRSVSMPDLSPLLPLRDLIVLDLKLGGTTDLRLLPEVGALRYLELWKINGLTDLSPIGKVESLRYLYLQALSQVTELPDFRRMTALRGIHIETLKRLRDVSPLRDAPALEELNLFDMVMEPSDVECLVGHPTLRTAWIGLGGVRKNAAAAEILGLPDDAAQTVHWRRIATDDSAR